MCLTQACNLKLMLLMPAERYFVPAQLSQHEQILLKDAEFHHLAHVMRTRKGESVELVNGKGALAAAVVEEIGRDKAHLRIQSVQEKVAPKKRMILAQAMPKQNRLDFILEKGTELGVDEFWLFPGELSIKKEMYPNQIERAEAVTISAMKQCGRLFLPSVVIKEPISQWAAFESSLFFGDVNPDAELIATAMSRLKLIQPIIFVTGPESGFTDAEVEHLKKIGAVGVKLHDNILRTDTASLVALSLIYHSI